MYSAIELNTGVSARVPIETLMMYCHACDSGEYTLESAQVGSIICIDSAGLIFRRDTGDSFVPCAQFPNGCVTEMHGVS